MEITMSRVQVFLKSLAACHSTHWDLYVQNANIPHKSCHLSFHPWISLCSECKYCSQVLPLVIPPNNATHTFCTCFSIVDQWKKAHSLQNKKNTKTTSFIWMNSLRKCGVIIFWNGIALPMSHPSHQMHLLWITFCYQRNLDNHVHSRFILANEDHGINWGELRKRFWYLRT